VFSAFAIKILLTPFACHIADPFEVAFKAADTKNGIVAVEKVKDQCLLAQLALVSFEGSVRVAALSKITDQYLIAKIAITSYDSILKNIALRMLSHDSISGFVRQLRTRSPNKYIESDLSALLPVIRILGYPEIINKVGKISSVEISWSEKTQIYTITGSNPSTELCKGEILNISIRFSENELILKERWEAKFPKSVDLAGPKGITFFPVSRYTGDRPKPVLDCLTQSEIITVAQRETKFRENNKDYLWFADRYNSINLSSDKLFDSSFDDMTYQTLLEEIAKKNDNWEIRCTAVKKLWSHFLLMKIATEDKDERVRNMAATVLYGNDN
jgi:hypothetical protein